MKKYRFNFNYSAYIEAENELDALVELWRMITQLDRSEIENGSTVEELEEVDE